MTRPTPDFVTDLLHEKTYWTPGIATKPEFLYQIAESDCMGVFADATSATFFRAKSLNDAPELFDIKAPGAVMKSFLELNQTAKEQGCTCVRVWQANLETKAFEVVDHWSVA